MRLPMICIAALCPAFCAAGPTVHHFTFENDSFFDVDRYYTNGVQWSTVRQPDERQGWAPLAWGAPYAEHTNIGQLMYTPSDIARPGPQAGDHPYAGLLYGERMWQFMAENQQEMTSLSARLGVTGPPSLAEQTQKLVHRILGRAEPLGWEYQIPARLALMLTLERRLALPAMAWEWGRVAAWGKLAVGNIQTYAGAGAMLTLGQGLPPLLPPPPGIHGTAAPDDSHCLISGLRCTAYAGVEWRYFQRNVFVEGPAITLRPLVRDQIAGLHLSWPGRKWFVQLQYTWRTPEFRSALPVYAHRFGALTLGTEW